MTQRRTAAIALVGVLGISAATACAQPRVSTAPAPQVGAVSQRPVSVPTAQALVPPDYVIGADDVLAVVFRREKDMSAEVTVRPDGMVTLLLLQDIQAAGLTPEQFRDKVVSEATKILKEEPTVTVVVKEIKSRRVFVTGEVARPGAYPIGTRLTVLQLIAMAGGLTEYAKSKDIVIIRDPAGGPARPGTKPTTFRFNYEAVRNLKNLASNIDLKPGDTVIVP